MRNLIPLTNTRSIVDGNGNLTQEARIFFEELQSYIPINGSGSPEGVIRARQGATYYDISATAGSIHYVKKLTDIGGDTSQGWVLA